VWMLWCCGRRRTARRPKPPRGAVERSRSEGLRNGGNPPA